MARKTSEIVRDYYNLAASANNMAPEDVRAKSLALRAEMNTILPTLTGVAAETRATFLREIGQHVHQLDRDAAGQRETAQYSPHMAQKAEETERETAWLRDQIDAISHIENPDWWTWAAPKMRSSVLSLAYEYTPAKE